ncbi:30S ribosomal protein S2 [Candidatus Uhrbacteria bacterium]|jgi:small subunit ribosomal protein S2|nr:30S ribosomal protein S2 [Candidatus Uhrbacteria bacterium]
MPLPTLTDLLKAGVHFGHRTSRWHPAMRQYIFGVRNGVHVIDIEQTRAQLEKAMAEIEEIVAKGGKIMLIGTKPQVQDMVEKYATECGMPYVCGRWLGGTFTNFEEIHKLVKQYLDLIDKRKKGELKKYTKLEQLQFDRKIDELDEKIGGLTTLTRLPEAVFVFDMRYDKTAVTEASKTGLKVFGLCDTNVSPALADVVIPGNDDAMSSLTLMGKLVMEAVKVGVARSKQTKAAAKTPAKTK